MSLPLLGAGMATDGPSAVLDLKFASLLSLTPSVGPTPSYTRASTGTYFDASGVLTTAAINGPRFDHVYNGSSWVSKGLLIEEARTNGWPDSLTVPTGYDGSLAPVPSSVVTAPDGTNSTLILTSIAGQNGSYYSSSATSHSVESIFFKNKSGGRYVAMHPAGGGASGVYFDIIDGLKIATFGSGIDGYIQNVGNGWFRCTVVKLTTTTSFEFSISDTYIPGSRPIGVNSVQVYAWGVQLESGSFPTSYIPTTTAAVTRSADICQISGTDFSGFWNQTEGSVVLSYDMILAPLVATTQRVFTAWNAGFSSGLVIMDDSSGCSVEVNPGAGFTLGSSVSPTNVALGYKVNDFATGRNGGAVLTDTSGAGPSGLNAMYIGNNVGTGSNMHNGHIARLRYFNTRLLNSQLVALST